jgi:endonuclease/exonuclease/phosphatase family metal-dependent hydrolase
MTQLTRIAICNLQTGIGTTRGYWQYLTTGWKYFLPRGPEHVRRAAAFLRSEAIDVVAFCEIEGGSKRSRGIDQVAMISELTSLRRTTFFPTLAIGRRINQGNAICTGFPLQHVKNHALPGMEPRFLSEAKIRIGVRDVRIFVTHLSLELKIRTPQIRHIANLVHQRHEAPTILAGDFNIAHEAELTLLAHSNLAKTASVATFPSWKPTKYVDHLFFSREFTVAESHTFNERRFSNHLPFIAAVELSD